MSMQRRFDDHRAFGPPAAGRGEAPWSPIDGGKISDHLVASLATGLRSAYEAQPQTAIPDTFAELISRLQTAEIGRR
ncbi:hypothetical protein [Methylobacterium iners]|uniref:Anti-sigma factor NepR domain-containing protein n=1 Tax=Methylobacterium iners TaxID=418707 RepID=A0ABQ4RWD0_9HYPH|nr:hypothetical protein [Methylobacterium iners]GJD94277.1 hypothetical protein OCOJLMKI_1479 [Methylobacterium iners]